MDGQGVSCSFGSAEGVEEQVLGIGFLWDCL